MKIRPFRLHAHTNRSGNITSPWSTPNFRLCMNFGLDLANINNLYLKEATTAFQILTAIFWSLLLTFHWSIHEIMVLIAYAFRHSLKIQTTRDFQQCGILTWIDSDEPMQPPFKLRNSKCRSISSLFSYNIRAASKGSDQTAHMRRLVWAFTGRTYRIFGNLMSWPISWG